MMIVLMKRLLCLLLCTSGFGLFVRSPSALFAFASGTAGKEALPSITAGLRHVNPAQKDRDIVVLITGCSSGIGEEAALALSAQSPRFKVWATMRNPTKSSLPTDRPNLKVASLDVTNEESIDAAVRHIVATDGAIDVVINNAGFGVAGNVEVVKLEEAQELFNVNVWGVVRLLQAVLPVMRTRRWGYIINLSSTSGVRGIPALDFYTSSKFALEGMMDSLRYSVAAYNVSITNVNAGPVKTPFAARFGSADIGGRGTREVEDSDEYLQLLTDRMIAGLRYRLNGPDAQPAAEIGHLLANLLTLRLNAKRLTDVPFNIGSTHDSQRLLEEVRVNPTGWGGVYSEIFKSLPPLPAPTEASELRRRRLQATQPSPHDDL
jgi:NAD(P)-dependent dehydrogenase (short-subunit alcohol dehydrogenase family)